MQLIQVLLPIYDNTGAALPQHEFRRVREELTARFGGLTAFTRAPAEGLWKDDEERTTRDDIVLFEVMTEELDRDWWEAYRTDLERRFRQDRIVIRAQVIELL